MLRTGLFIIFISLTSPLPLLASYITVKQNESLNQISRDYKIPIERLIHLNKINNPNHIYRGQKLILHPETAENIKSQSTTHTVKAGETLSEIAMKYGIQKKDIIIENKLKDQDIIYLNQKLIIPNRNNQKLSQFFFYKIKPGDSLNEIAAMYKVTSFEIATENKIRDIDFLEVGDIIKIPKSNYNKVIKQQNITQNKYNKDFHIVSEGETLSGISETYNISINDIVSINNLSNRNSLNIGDKLFLSEKPHVDPNPIKNNNKKFNMAFANPEWKDYGPLKIDWSNWQLMNNSYVTPTLHRNGKALYLAINCSGRKLNATGVNGNWRNWISPNENFEHQLINDLCKNKKHVTLL